MIFRRSVLHFQSAKLLRNPLQVGYPPAGESVSGHELLSSVFFAGKREKLADLKNHFKIDLEVLENFDFAAFQAAERPQRAKGLALFLHQHAYNKRIQLEPERAWKSLPEEVRSIYFDDAYASASYESSLRVWKGYEIVEFLRRFLGDHLFNPYVVLGLKPWEIIMDKFRSKRVHLDDYYDHIIKEAMKGTARNAYQNYYKQLKPDLEAYPLPRLDAVMKQLSPSQRHYFRRQAREHELHVALLTRPPELGVMGYSAFLREFKNRDGALLKVPEIQSAASDAWHKLSPEQQAHYSRRQHHVHSTHAYRHEKLVWRTRLVLNYMYNVCGTDTGARFEDVDREFDRALGDRFYIGRNYVAHHIYYRGNTVRVARPK